SVHRVACPEQATVRALRSLAHRLLDLQYDGCVAPEALELVEVALLGHERVHDDVAEVDEDPAAGGVALDADRRAPRGLRSLDDAVRGRLDLPMAAAALPGADVRARRPVG